MIDPVDLFVASCVATAIGMGGVGLYRGGHEFHQMRAATHHIVMSNEEVARRWREKQLDANTE